MTNDKDNYYSLIKDAIDNYYQYNPDTLMPLLMMALALKGNVKITEGSAAPDISACILSPNEIKDYEWVKLNGKLKRQVGKWIKDGVSIVAVSMEIGRSLIPIYHTIKQNDERDVVMEYHHRIGRLVHHSNNQQSERAQRQYATFVLATELLNVGKLSEEEHIKIFSYILEKSGLQPKRPRIRIALALRTLLNYDGKGLVYNPFTGCSIAGALLRSKNNYYGDGNLNEKIYAAGLLLNYGMGVSNEHFIQRDSRNWLTGKKIDYIITTYTGYINGESAFDFCLGKCLNDKNFNGKYAGAVLPREIFEKQTVNFKEALERDWIEAIVLLSFGEAIVVVNAQKDNEHKGKIRFSDGTNPFTQNLPIDKLLKHMLYSRTIKVSDVKKQGYLKSLVLTEPADIEDHEKVRLGDLVTQIPRSVYQLDDYDEDDRNLAYINHAETYICNSCWDENIYRKPIRHLFSPVYMLDKDCLIVNSAGHTEPRMFNADAGFAFFEDGYAFAPNNGVDLNWLVSELDSPYITHQLHPYGYNDMVPEPLTEDDYLNLIVYKPILNKEEERDNEELSDEEKAHDALPAGFVIENDNKRYTILNYLSCGAFGYTYRADMLNQHNGLKEIVAIKEFYPRLRDIVAYRDNTTNCRMQVDLDSPYLEEKFTSMRKMFYNEGDFLRRMSDTPDNHVTQFKSLFDFEPTGTIYYIMKLYKGATLDDIIKSGQMPTSEPLIIKNIVLPLCKALQTMESHMILHLDIKPDNIVIDENGEAVLIDFGVAQQYNDEGDNTDVRGDIHQYGEWSAPENRGGAMKHFCPQSDIYSVAAILYTLLSGGKTPSYEPNENIWLVDQLNCSEEIKKAINEGMAEYSNDRPANAQRFLNLLPGCEDIKL